MFWLPVLVFFYTVFTIGLSIRWARRRARRPAVHTVILVYLTMIALWWSVPVSFMVIVGSLAGADVTPLEYLLIWGSLAFPFLLSGLICFAMRRRLATTKPSQPQ